IPEQYYRNFTITPPTRKAKAVLLMHPGNADLKHVLASMKQVEDTFNTKHQYPWLFLSEAPFSAEFKKYTTEITDSPVTYGLIPKEYWVQPDWIDEEKASEAREKLAETSDALYAGKARNLFRFHSGFFFRHELLKDYDYYWRVEPDAEFFCDLDYDPFLYMQDNKKVYGFTVVFPENKATIPTLWNATKEFMALHPEHLAKDNALGFLAHGPGPIGESYNNCQFWSNFEIGDLNFYRSKAYMDFFEHLDKAGGFYYERWSDAPVHTIAASLMASKDQIHYFEDIGYQHAKIQNCPSGDSHAKGRCSCKFSLNRDFARFVVVFKYVEACH
ncbi:glycosyltransferase family 15 protein, partial [Sphaerobolus stellatus SS14]